ncbi:MAG: hypothetical protein AB1758_02420 [Candidatus Eremiobacterota bacterium]
MRLALDSNGYTDLCLGIPEVVEVVAGAAEIYMPLMVLAEQRAGFARGTRRTDNEKVLAGFPHTHQRPLDRLAGPAAQRGAL